jgi:hypothetical protein
VSSRASGDTGTERKPPQKTKNQKQKFLHIGSKKGKRQRIQTLLG